MGNSLSNTKLFFIISGIIQISIYTLFLFTPIERMFRMSTFWLLLLIVILLTSFILGMLAANRKPPECNGELCDFKTTQIIANIVCVLSTVMIIIFLFTDILENTWYGTIICSMCLTFFGMIYINYMFNIRESICMCNEDINTITKKICIDKFPNECICTT